MGSKRPEQAHKDFLSTDIKTRTDDERIHAADKQRLHTVRGKLAPSKKGENPALADLKKKRARRDEE